MHRLRALFMASTETSCRRDERNGIANCSIMQKMFVSFVDGHVNYIKMYWNSAANSDGFYSMAFFYDPPAGYDYQWSGD